MTKEINFKSEQFTKIERKGRIYYALSYDARLSVGTVINSDHEVQRLVSAMITAMANIATQREEMWRQIHAALGTDPLVDQLHYTHATGEIEVVRFDENTDD